MDTQSDKDVIVEKIKQLRQIAGAVGVPNQPDGRIDPNFYNKHIKPHVNRAQTVSGLESSDYFSEGSPFVKGLAEHIGASEDRESLIKKAAQAGMGGGAEDSLRSAVSEWVQNNPSKALPQPQAQAAPTADPAGKPPAGAAEPEKPKEAPRSPPLQGGGLLGATMNDQMTEAASAAKEADLIARQEAAQRQAIAAASERGAGGGGGGGGGNPGGAVSSLVGGAIGGTVNGVVSGFSTIKNAIMGQRRAAADAVSSARDADSADARNTLLRLNSNAVRVAQQGVLSSLDRIEQIDDTIQKHKATFLTAESKAFAARSTLLDLSKKLFPDAPSTLLDIADRSGGDINKALVAVKPGGKEEALPEMVNAIKTQESADLLKAELGKTSLALQGEAADHAGTLKNSIDYLGRNDMIPQKDQQLYAESLEKADQRLGRIGENSKELREGLDLPNAEEQDQKLEGMREAIKSIVENILASIRKMFGMASSKEMDGHAPQHNAPSGPARSGPSMS